MKRKFKKSANPSKWLSKYVPRPLAINRQAPGLGRSLQTKLRTEFYVNVTPAASGIFTGFLNPGSCFDPAGDLAAMQPAMFDQLAAMYARYLVTGCSVTIAASLTSIAAGSPAGFVIAAYPSTVSTALATFQAAASQSYAQTRMFYHGGDPITIKFSKLNTQKIVGSRLPVIAEDCGALVGASPTTGQNIVIPLFIQNFIASVQNITLKVLIVQDVIFDQKINNVDA